MAWTEADVRTWKRKDSPYWSVKIPGRSGSWISSRQTSQPEAIAWALRQANGQYSPSVTLQTYTKDFFVSGKCRYLAVYEGNGHEATLKHWDGMRQLLTTYIWPKWGNYLLTSIIPSEFSLWLVKVKTVRTGALMSSAQRKKLQQAFQTIFAHAVVEGVLSTNPMASLPGVVVRSAEREIFTQEELAVLFPPTWAALEAVWGDPRLGLAYRVLWEAALRPNELARLQWADWRPDHKLFLVRITKTEKKGVKLKPGPVSPETAKLIDEHPAVGLVSPWSRVDTLGKLFCRQAAKVIDLRGRTLYCLRHTANTSAVTDYGEEFARLIMAHKTKRMTQTYDHPTESDVLKRTKS